MKQQINLYQAEFHPKQVRLPARQVLTISITAITFMFLINGVLFGENHYLNTKVESLTQRLQRVTANNTVLQNKVDEQKVDDDLQLAVVEAGKQLRARQKIMLWVDQSSKDNKVYFSSLLEGLSRQHVPGLWLSSVDIEEGGQVLNLQGNTLNPKLMPELLAKLNSEPAFVGREFKKALLKEDDQYRGVSQFVLTTQNKSDKQKGAVTKSGSRVTM